jgi:4-amino-4-deoxy-L-arabinose transferase-like glycosyltransferase
VHFQKKYLPLIIIVIYFCLQLPFLKADPDTIVDPNTRGAWTDEGLYASQIKNLVNHGTFDLKENSTFVRGPVFNIIQLPFFFIFGTNLLVARIITLLATLLVLTLFLKEEKLRNFGIFLSLFALLEFHIFQFAHYALSEMICIDFIMLSLYFLLKVTQNDDRKKKLLMILLSSLFIFLCYATKIQYLYVAAILPVTTFLIAFATTVGERKIMRRQYSLFALSVLFSMGFIVIYYLLWYLPNKEFYDYVMASESGGRYQSTYQGLKGVAQYNWEHLLWIKELKVLISHFFVVFILAMIFFIFKKKNAVHSVIALFSLMWVMLELHKIPMSYLPNRYLLSLFFASAVFISAFYSELTFYFKKIKFVFFILSIAFGIYNLSMYNDALTRRSYQISAVNEYLSKYDLKEKPVIGAWASAFCWNNKAITFPVWNNYFNWKDPIITYKPAVVVSESDENESDATYRNQGIDLNKLSDSNRIFNVRDYKIALYWIKE